MSVFEHFVIFGLDIINQGTIRFYMIRYNLLTNRIEVSCSSYSLNISALRGNSNIFGKFLDSCLNIYIEIVGILERFYLFL